MMADYERVTLRAVFSANNDYSDPKQDTEELQATGTPDQIIQGEIAVVTAGTDIIPAALLTTGDTFLLRNRDSTNFVTANFTDSDGNDSYIAVPALKLCLVSGWDPSVPITVYADTDVCEIYFWASGTYTAPVS
jgi:hypothetical protein